MHLIRRFCHANKEMRIQGQTDIPLNAKGEAQANEVSYCNYS